jgi:hypothetical protein
MENPPDISLSPSEKRTLQKVSEGEFQVAELDWVALQRGSCKPSSRSPKACPPMLTLSPLARDFDLLMLGGHDVRGGELPQLSTLTRQRCGLPADRPRCLQRYRAR